jgi:uncharacterized protein with HEPN domain
MGSEDFEQSDITIDAVVRNLEVIGEAARKLPAEVRSRTLEIEGERLPPSATSYPMSISE